MASKLLEGPLRIEEPFNTRPGFQGRSTIQEISQDEFEIDEVRSDPIDTYLDEQSLKIYDMVNCRQISNPIEKMEAFSQEFLRRLLPLNCLEVFLSPYFSDYENDSLPVLNDGLTVQLEIAHFEALDRIRQTVSGKKLFLSLSTSSRSRLASDPRFDETIRFLDVFLGTLDESQNQFLIGSYRLPREITQQFIIDRIRSSLDGIWPDKAWMIESKNILMVLLDSGIVLHQETLEQTSLRGCLIIPNLQDIVSSLLPIIECRFSKFKTFVQALENFIYSEPLFYELFTYEFPEYFSVDFQNYFNLVDFFARHYWEIRQQICEFCAPGEDIHNHITKIFTFEHLCALYETASVWQSLVNITLMLHNYWFYPRSDYSALIVALELDNILRHGAGVLCDELKQIDASILQVYARFFPSTMPLVPPTIDNQMPLYSKLFHDFVPRGIEEPEGEDYLHNLTAVVYSSREIFGDYNYEIHEHSIRFIDPPAEDGFFVSRYEHLGNYELNDYLESPLPIFSGAFDDNQLDVLRNLQDIPANIQAQCSKRRRHQSSKGF